MLFELVIMVNLQCNDVFCLLPSIWPSYGLFLVSVFKLLSGSVFSFMVALAVLRWGVLVCLFLLSCAQLEIQWIYL